MRASRGALSLSRSCHGGGGVIPALAFPLARQTRRGEGDFRARREVKDDFHLLSARRWREWWRKKNPPPYLSLPPLLHWKESHWGSTGRRGGRSLTLHISQIRLGIPPAGRRNWMLPNKKLVQSDERNRAAETAKSDGRNWWSALCSPLTTMFPLFRLKQKLHDGQLEKRFMKEWMSSVSINAYGNLDFRAQSISVSLVNSAAITISSNRFIIKLV